MGRGLDSAAWEPYEERVGKPESPHVHAPSLPGFQEWQCEWPDAEADEDIRL